MRNRISKSRRDDILLTVGFNPRRRRGIPIILAIMAIMAIMAILVGCEEAKRYEISGNDTTPPGTPIFIDSKPLYGGARVFFRAPADEDVLSVEVSYSNADGKKVRFAASYFADSLDVYGFGREGEHAIEMYAVDRAGNRSTSIHETVTSLEPPVVSLAKSMQVLPSFASMLVKWTYILREPVYVWVDFSYAQNGVRHDYTNVFASNRVETRSIDGLNLYDGEPVSVKVNVKDKYGNVAHAKDTSIVLLTDEIIDKAAWRLPEPGTVMDDVMQANGSNLELLIDGLNDIDIPLNYFLTSMDNPWSIIIDLGETYELSRIVTHQCKSDYKGGPSNTNSDRGNLYRGDNVMAYNLYVWDETIHSWEWLSRYDVRIPIVSDENEYILMGQAGDMTFLYPAEPKFSKPTRWLRFEAINGKYISEITLYGRKAQ